MLVISGSSHLELAKEIAVALNANYMNVSSSLFNDSELDIKLDNNILPQTIFIVQSTCNPVNNNLMELLLITDAVKRSGAKKIIAIIPYFGYSRQDRRISNYQPISRSLVIKLLKAAGIGKIITLDIHSHKPGDKKRGLYNIPSLDVFLPLFINKFSRLVPVTLVSPDKGSNSRVEAFGKELNLDFAYIHKTRMPDRNCKVEGPGELFKGKNCIIIDDIVDSANTLCKSAEFLAQHGAKSINACVTHAVLSGQAATLVENSPVQKLFITNSIANPPINPKIEVLPIQKVIANFIQQTFLGAPAL